jgi:hypothetical protein
MNKGKLNPRIDNTIHRCTSNSNLLIRVSIMTQQVNNLDNNNTIKMGIREKRINTKEEHHQRTTLTERGRITHLKNPSSRIKMLIMIQCSSSTTTHL